jgi:hypothetical protein
MTGVSYSVGKENFFLFATAFKLALAHPASCPVGIVGKVARHEADHSPVSRAEVLTIHGAIPPLLHMPSWQST